MATINPEILVWARETAGLSPEDAAHAIGLHDAFGLSGAQRLAAIESGDDEPTRKLLVKMAEKYRRSLLIFYLAKPPKKGGRGQDFRTVQGPGQSTPDLDALLRDIRMRQDLIRSMVEDGEGAPIAFVGSATRETPVEKLAGDIAASIQFSLRAYQDQPDIDHAFQYLRQTIESAGVFVLLAGNLGSHHSNIAPEIFRGFAVADKTAPLIVINDQDARSARPFTALHELAHLWLGSTGISGQDADNRIEQYCNDVAGEILLPASELTTLRRFATDGVDELAGEIARTSARCKESRQMVAYRLYRAGVVQRDRWMTLGERFRREWEESRQPEKKTGESRANYYTVRRHRLGAALLDLVRRVLGEGNTTYTKAGHVLGVKPGYVNPLLYPKARSTP